MKNYDAYIMVHSEEKNNDIGMLEGTDIIKVKDNRHNCVPQLQKQIKLY